MRTHRFLLRSIPSSQAVTSWHLSVAETSLSPVCPVSSSHILQRTLMGWGSREWEEGRGGGDAVEISGKMGSVALTSSGDGSVALWLLQLFRREADLGVNVGALIGYFTSLLEASGP